MSTSSLVAAVDDRPDPEVIRDARRKRQILLAMCIALMGVISSVSILNVAQQDLALDFDASQGTVLWILNAYTLTLAALLLPIGAVGDRWGRRPVLIVGLVLFALATIACALAPTSGILLAGRVLTGAAAAMIMPVTLSVITSTFPPEERGQAIGIWAGVAGAGGVVGMFVAALMVDVANWRWAFVLPLVLMGASLSLTLRSVPNSREHTGHRFDTVGSVLSALAIGGIVLGIHEGPERGWTDVLTLAGLTAGIAALVGFIAWELRQANPLLDVRAFANRSLTAGSLTVLLIFGLTFGIFLVLFPFFQAILGWSALRSAAAILPMMMVMMPATATAPRVAKRFGRRLTVLVGLVVIAIGLSLLALRASVDGGYFAVLPGLLVMGLGIGLTTTPSTEAITESLPADKQGVASAINDATREVGGAVGVALLGSILSSGYRSSLDETLVGLPADVVHVAEEGIGQALGVAASSQSGLDPSTSARLVDAARNAFVDGWTLAMWVGVGIVAVAFAYVLLRGPRDGVDDVLDHEAHQDTQPNAQLAEV